MVRHNSDGDGGNIYHVEENACLNCVDFILKRTLRQKKFNNLLIMCVPKTFWGA
jgi:hypothetical protein